jgi:hypothetical protein
MSHVLLTSAMSSRVLTVRPDAELSAMLPAMPTAVREFQSSDQLAILTEIYDNDRRPHTVDISSSILTTTGQPVFTARDSRTSEALGRGEVGRYGVVYEVPLSRFEPGLYVLRIEAQSRAERTAPVRRDVLFRIR